MTLLDVVSNPEQLFSRLLLCFDELELEISKGRKRHFENSEVHKMKTRKMQSLLVLTARLASDPAISLAFKSNLVDVLNQELLEHNNQTSVRYLLEWTAIVAIYYSTESCPAAAEQLLQLSWSALETAAVTKMGAVPGFINIIAHLAARTEMPNHESLMEKALLMVLISDGNSEIDANMREKSLIFDIF